MKILATPPACKVAGLSGSEVFDAAFALPRWKRVLDISCCVVALPILFRCTLFVEVLNLFAVTGPILFFQERVGHRGRQFKLYKFRTMHVRADVSAHQMYFAQLVRSNVPMHKLDVKG